MTISHLTAAAVPAVVMKPLAAAAADVPGKLPRGAVTTDETGGRVSCCCPAVVDIAAAEIMLFVGV